MMVIMRLLTQKTRTILSYIQQLKLYIIFRPYLSCENAWEGESEGASEVLMKKTVDDWVGGGVYVNHVLGHC